MTRYWTDEEEKTLITMANNGATVFEIAKALDRTPIAIILRTRAISGLERPDSKGRMPEDYFDQTKTIRQVFTNHGRSWTDAENAQLLKDFFNGSNVFQLSDKFNRIPNAIIQQIKKLKDKPGGMTELFNRAKLLLGKKRL